MPPLARPSGWWRVRTTPETGDDGKRRSRVEGASETWYNYTVGFDVVSTEDDADGSTGALTMTNVVLRPTSQVSATLGDLAGATPSTGTARYYATDHLGSTRSAWDASKTNVGSYEFTPYGGEYNHTGAALASLAGAYTGKPWDDTAQLFHFPFRQYSPDMARWTTRDPLGMVDGPNVYAYVVGNPIMHYDPDGRLLAAAAWLGRILLRLLPRSWRGKPPGGLGGKIKKGCKTLKNKPRPCTGSRRSSYERYCSKQGKWPGDFPHDCLEKKQKDGRWSIVHRNCGRLKI